MPGELDDVAAGATWLVGHGRHVEQHPHRADAIGLLAPCQHGGAGRWRSDACRHLTPGSSVGGDGRRRFTPRQHGGGGRWRSDAGLAADRPRPGSESRLDEESRRGSDEVAADGAPIGAVRWRRADDGWTSSTRRTAAKKGSRSVHRGAGYRGLALIRVPATEETMTTTDVWLAPPRNLGWVAAAFGYR